MHAPDHHNPATSTPDPNQGAGGHRDQVREILANVGNQLDQLRQLQEEHDAHARELTEREKSLVDREQAIQNQMQELADARSGLETERASWTSEREEYQRLYDDSLAELELRERAAETAREELGLAQSEHQQECVRWQEEQRAIRAALDEERAALEQMAQSRVAAEQLERELLELREVADAQSARDADLVRQIEAISERSDRTERTLEERTEALAESAETLQQLSLQCRELKTSLDDAEEARQRAEAEMGQRVAAAESADDERLTSLARERDEAAAAAETAQAELAKATAKCGELVKRIERTEETARNASNAAARLSEVQQELASAKAALASAQAATTGGGAAAEDLRAKAEQIAFVAKHLKRRQRRLRVLRAACKQRGGDATQSAKPQTFDEHAANIRKFEKLRHEVTDMQSALAIKERRMIRRWAGPRATMAIVWMMVLAGLAGAASWFAADHFVPATVTASVVLEAKGRQVGPMPDDVTERWKNWHTEILDDAAFHTSLAKRFGERQWDAYDRPDPLKTRLAQDLTVDAAEPARLTLTLAGKNRRETLAFLDLVATTIEARSSNANRKRADSAWAVVKGERQERGRLVYASLDPIPIEDNRLAAAGIMFGVLYAVLCTLVLFVYRRLLRVKREFDDDDTLFDDIAPAKPMSASPFSKVA